MENSQVSHLFSYAFLNECLEKIISYIRNIYFSFHIFSAIYRNPNEMTVRFKVLWTAKIFIICRKTDTFHGQIKIKKNGT